MFESVRPIATLAEKPRAGFRVWDPRYPEVADLVRRAVESASRAVSIDHVGSTAVPDCPGKGVVDLVALHDPAKFDEAKSLLTALGFVPQTSDFQRQWPEHRPMLLGHVAHKEATYLVYVHVVVRDSYEAERFRIFRDRLRDDEELRSKYVEVKRSIIARGITDTDEYAVLKRPIIHEILDDRYSEKPGRTP